MRKFKVMLYGPGNARDHATYLAFNNYSTDFEVQALLTKQNAILQSNKNVFKINGLETAISFAKDWNPDLILIMNREELISGYADIFRNNKFKTIGISRSEAILETSKEYSKNFLKKYNIPTPEYYIARNEQAAVTFLTQNWGKEQKQYILKNDGLGNGAYSRIIIPDNLEQALDGAKRFYKANPTAHIIIEERIHGYELSLHLFVNDNEYSVMPPVQDYKKLLPNNEGPITSGVASVATTDPFPKDLYSIIQKKIIEPTINGLKEEGFSYQSILYIGLMVTDKEIFVLEYNVRAGNPEWLSLTGLLKTSLGEVVYNFSHNNIHKINTCWQTNRHSLAVYALTADYPQKIRKNYTEEINGLQKITPSTTILSNCIIKKNNKFYPANGRIFALRRSGENFSELKKQLFNEFSKIKIDGLYYRTDINHIDFKTRV